MSKVAKIVVIGDEKVGKTNLVGQLQGQSFSEEYNPTVLDNQNIPFKHEDNQLYEMQLYDTGGEETNDGMRSLCFQFVS